MRNGAPKPFLGLCRDKVFRTGQTLSHATTKCFVPPKHFLTPRQSVSSRPNTFSRHDKVFRPAQSLSCATAKCFVLPKHFLAPRQSVSARPITFSRHDKVFRPAQTLFRATRKCLVPFFQPNLARWVYLRIAYGRRP